MIHAIAEQHRRAQTHNSSECDVCEYLGLLVSDDESARNSLEVRPGQETDADFACPFGFGKDANGARFAAADTGEVLAVDVLALTELFSLVLSSLALPLKQ